MRGVIIPSPWIGLSPRGRMDASYWIRVMEEVERRGIAHDDGARVRVVILTIEALYETAGQVLRKNRLGDLVERAAQNFNDDFKEQQ